VAQGTLAAHKKGALKARKSLVFIDESGFMLQPLVRATWAPSGHTPVLKSWDRHDRLTVFSALTISPVRGRVGLYFMVQRTNAKSEDTKAFVRSVRRHLGRDIVVIWDRLSAHRSAARQLEGASGSAYQFEFLPAYAPELNPVEYVWSESKYVHLANFLPRDIDHLETELEETLCTIGGRQEHLRACLAHARLSHKRR
jgi:transposase